MTVYVLIYSLFMLFYVLMLLFGVVPENFAHSFCLMCNGNKQSIKHSHTLLLFCKKKKLLRVHKDQIGYWLWIMNSNDTFFFYISSTTIFLLCRFFFRFSLILAFEKVNTNNKIGTYMFDGQNANKQEDNSNKCQTSSPSLVV